MIEYQVDEQMLEEVQAKLGEMSRKAPTVISRALNKVAVTARVDLANKAQATYTVKSGGFKKDMTIRKASAGRLESVIHSQGKPPIKKLSSNSIPKMIGNEEKVYGVVKPSIDRNLQHYVEQQIELLTK